MELHRLKNEVPSTKGGMWKTKSNCRNSVPSRLIWSRELHPGNSKLLAVGVWQIQYRVQNNKIILSAK